MRVGSDAGTPPGSPLSIYATGFFSLSVLPMSNFLIPLWANHIGASPAMIGLAVGARSVLPVLFSIHGGALMDRLGTRRLTVGFAIASAVMAPLYPLVPLVGALILLQLFNGFAQAGAWIGAQTQLGQMSRGNREIVGRFTFVSTVGNSSAPLLAGVTWDLLGPWGAFGLMGLWSMLLTLCALRTPGGPMRPAPPRKAREWRLLMPQFRDYVEAIRLWSAPIIAFVMLASMLMSVVYAMRNSFYPVYLDGIGLPKTTIGLLVTTGSLISAGMGLVLGRLARVFAPLALLMVAIVGGTVAIASTPLTVEIGWLFGLAVMFGILGGPGFPLILSELAREVDVSQQGICVGLRTTVNRSVALAAPVTMGVIAEFAGLLVSFLALAGLNIALVSVLATRLPALRRRRP